MALEEQRQAAIITYVKALFVFNIQALNNQDQNFVKRFLLFEFDNFWPDGALALMMKICVYFGNQILRIFKGGRTALWKTSIIVNWF